METTGQEEDAAEETARTGGKNTTQVYMSSQTEEQRVWMETIMYLRQHNLIYLFL